MGRCKAFVKEGKKTRQCKNRSRKGSNYCESHKEKEVQDLDDSNLIEDLDELAISEEETVSKASTEGDLGTNEPFFSPPSKRINYRDMLRKFAKAATRDLSLEEEQRVGEEEHRDMEEQNKGQEELHRIREEGRRAREEEQRVSEEKLRALIAEERRASEEKLRALMAEERRAREEERRASEEKWRSLKEEISTALIAKKSRIYSNFMSNYPRWWNNLCC